MSGRVDTMDLRLESGLWRRSALAALVLSVTLSACAGGTPKSSKEPALATQEPAAEPTEESAARDSGAGGPHSDASSRPATKEASSEDEFGEAEEAAPRGSADLDAAPAEKKEKGTDLMESLSDYRHELDELLRPKALSCDGAKPIVDAICSISERICNTEDPSSLNQPADCKKSKNACDKAKKNYDDKCG